MMTAAALSSSPAGLLDPALVARLAGLVAAAPGRARRASYAPFDGGFIGEVPTCTAEDVRAAQGGRGRPRWSGPGGHWPSGAR